MGPDGEKTRAHSYKEVWGVSEIKKCLGCFFAKNSKLFLIIWRRDLGDYVFYTPPPQQPSTTPQFVFTNNRKKRSKIIKEGFT